MTSWSSRNGKEGFFCTEGNIFNIRVLSQYIVHWIHFQNIHVLKYKKSSLHTLSCLSLKSSKSLSQLQENKFKHKFYVTLNLICNCSEDIDISCHYLLHCSLFTNERLALLNDIQGLDNSTLDLCDSHTVKVLLHGRKILDISSNTNVLNATIDFLLKTKSFDERLS